MAKLKELQKKKRREKRFRREAKKALDPDERKTLKAIVELWFEAHPEILRNGLFSRMVDYPGTLPADLGNKSM